MTWPAVKEAFDQEGFRRYVQALPVSKWRPNMVVWHNTPLHEMACLRCAVRGGSWYAHDSSCSSTARGEGRAASGGYHSVGFRVAASTA